MVGSEGRIRKITMPNGYFFEVGVTQIKRELSNGAYVSGTVTEINKISVGEYDIFAVVDRIRVLCAQAIDGMIIHYDINDFME